MDIRDTSDNAMAVRCHKKTHSVKENSGSDMSEKIRLRR